MKPLQHANSSFLSSLRRRQNLATLLAVCCWAFWSAPAAQAQFPEETTVDSEGFLGITYQGKERSRGVGRSVVHAGDVNADGKPDLLVGAEGAPGVPGRVFVLLGGRGGPLLKRDLPGSSESVITLLTGSPGQDRFGAFVAGAGDVDGDGVDDFLIGAPSSAFPLPPSGGVFLVFGDAHFTSIAEIFQNPGRAILLTTAEPRGLLGAAGSGIGDVNADGFDDIALGLPGGLTGAGGEGPPHRTGKVIVVFGGRALRGGNAIVFLDRPEAPASLEIPGFEPESELGYSVAPVGDFDGDGLRDFAIGAPELRGDGAVFVVFGAAGFGGPIDLSATDGQRAVELRPTLERSRFGESLAGGLDATGDGPVDLLVGAPGMARDGFLTGGAVLIAGGSRFRNVGVAPVPGPTGVLFRGAIESQAGSAVALVPDLNQDGDAEVLVGAPDAFGGRGAAYLVLDVPQPGGSVFLDQLDRNKQVVFKIGAFQAHLGRAVAGLPDRNGDLRGDFALGAPGVSGRELPSAGAVFEINVPPDPESPAPRNLKASLLSGGRVRLTWTLAAAYRSLRVFRDGAPIDGQLPGHLQQFTDVSPGKGKHVYFIEANGDPDVRSNLAELEVRGLPVRELSCRQIDTSLTVRVSWAVSDRYDSLAVSLDGVRVAELGPGTTTHELETTLGEHLIEVYDPHNESESDRARCIVEVKRSQLPNIDGFVCAVESPKSVRLTWDVSPAYRLYLLKRNGIPLAKLSHGESTYLDIGVPSGSQRYEIIGLNEDFHSGPGAVCEVVVEAAGGVILRGRVEWLGDGPVRFGSVRVFDGASGEPLGASAQVNNLGRFDANVQKRASYRVDYNGHLDSAVLDCTIPVPFEKLEVSVLATSLDQDVVLELPPPVFLVAAPGAESPEQGPAARWRTLRARLDGEVFHFALVLPSGVARGAHFLARGIEEIREYLRSELGSAPPFVDLVAYGSAGLSARAYVAGTEQDPVRRLVLVGTPNLGTVRGHLEARAELAGRPIRLPGDDGVGDCLIGTDAFNFSSAAEQTREFLEELNSKVTFLRGARTHLIAGTGGLRVLDPVLGCSSHDNRICESSALGGVSGATLHSVPEDHEMLGRGVASVELLQSILTAAGGGGEVEDFAPALGGGAGGAEASHSPGDVYSGVLEPGGQGNFPMISDTSESIIIILNTDQPGGINFRVVTPTGKSIDPPAAGALEGVEYQTYGDGEGHIVQAYKLAPCELGTYVAQLENPAGGEPLQYSLEAYLESGLAFEVSAEPGEIELTQSAMLLAQLTRNGQAETGSTVEARVWRPDGNLVILPLLDDGQGSDSAAGDGIYSASVPSDNQPGIHEVELSATASIGPITLYRREATTRFQVRSDLIAFSGELTSAANDDDADQVLEDVHVDGAVVSKASGVFLITGKLVDSSGNLVAEGGTLFGLSGPQAAPVRIYFSGSDIYAAHRNGPFTLSELRLLDGTAGFVEADRRTNALVTQAFSWSSFGVAPSTQRFVRADSNGDAKIDISDAVAILDYLFNGTRDIACHDAADADASGSLGVTDAIFVLDFLFAGKGQIPQPFPACGALETLGCESFAACD